MRHVVAPILLALLVPLSGCGPEAPGPPMTRHAYVWQTRWSPEVDAAVARAAPVLDGFMALCGEVDSDGKTFSFQPAEPVARTGEDPVVPVLRARKGLGDALSGGRTGEAAEFILNALPAAARAPDGPGVQLDYDCPTAALADYAALLEALRGRLPGVTLSFTALPDWLNSADFPRLARGADYYVLQVHSLDRPAGPDAPHVLCDPEKARAWARRAAGMGRPFFIALPTHRYRLLFDASGKFRALTAEQDPGPPPPGWRAREAAADPAGIAALVREWTADPPRNCRGIVWFRLPVDGDRMNLPWGAFAKLIAGEAPTAEVVAEWSSPRPGLRELRLRATGDCRPPGDVRCAVHWPAGAVMAYDVLGGYTGEPAPAGDGVTLRGPAPEPGEEAVMAAWFRLGPDVADPESAIQCGLVASGPEGRSDRK